MRRAAPPPAEPAAHLSALITNIRRQFPRFRIVPKHSHRLSRVIDFALRGLTLGGQRHYLTRYHTVIGDTLYVPSCWDHTSCIDKIILLRHEWVHLRQRRRYGTLIMSVMYLCWPLPIGLAYGRAQLEWEAYRETLRATLQWYGPEALRQPALRQTMIERFTGPDYLWMWPFPKQVGRWFDDAVAALLIGATVPVGTS